ncbi:MAG: hypothetical protein ACR2F8_03005 [Caulobacteraceae bacterium]
MLVSPELGLFGAACAAVSAACAAYCAMRDGRWRKTGLARQLEARIEAAQRTADDWPDTPLARKIMKEQDRCAQLLNSHDQCLLAVATRTDLARIEGQTEQVRQLAKAARDGVDRIEGLLLRRALWNEG